MTIPPEYTAVGVVLASIALPARGLTAEAVNEIPFSGKDAGAWESDADKAANGPLSRYLSNVLLACNTESSENIYGWDPTVEIVSWVNSSKAAQFDLITKKNLEVAFPISMDWAVSDTTYHRMPSGATFVPVVASPGTTILVPDDWAPTDVTGAVFSSTIALLLLTMLALAVIAGVMVWLADRTHRKSNFPHDFKNGGGIGVWWAIVTLTTVGYGDRVPKSKMGRFVGIVWMIIGVVLITLMQGTVISQLGTGTTQVFLDQAFRTADNLAGSTVGAVKFSPAEWRIRSRGAKVVTFDTVESASSALAARTVDAIAVDTLAAAVVVGDLINNDKSRINVRPDGSIRDTTTYGFLLSAEVSNLQALSTQFGPQNLSECVRSFSEIGTGDYDYVTYFDNYVDMAFRTNVELENRLAQDALSDKALTTAATASPLVAALIVALAWYYDRWVASAGGRSTGLSIQADSSKKTYSGLTDSVDHDDESMRGRSGLSDSAEPDAGDRNDGTITRTRSEVLALQEDDEYALYDASSPDPVGSDVFRSLAERHTSELKQLSAKQAREMVQLTAKADANNPFMA